MMRAADATTQLMQLREAELVGAIDDDGVRGRHVDAAFDDGGADQHVAALMIEIEHDLLEFALAHLAMADGDARFGHQLGQRAGGFLDGLDAVVHEVDLSAAADFAQAGLAYRRRIPLRDEGLDRQARRRRRRDQRQFAQSAHRHVERARDRRGGQGQHIDLGAQLLQALLVLHAEAMLFVDDEQAEAREPDAALQQSMRADDDIDLAGFEALQDLIRPRALLRKRDSDSTCTGQSAKRSAKV